MTDPAGRIILRDVKNTSDTFYIQEKNQSTLKGSFWGFITVASINASVGMIGTGAASLIVNFALKDIFQSKYTEYVSECRAPKSSLMMLVCPSFNTLKDYIEMSPITAHLKPISPTNLFLGIAAASIVLSCFTIIFTGFCFENAIHHLGPKFDIIKKEKLARGIR